MTTPAAHKAMKSKPAAPARSLPRTAAAATLLLVLVLTVSGPYPVLSRLPHQQRTASSTLEREATLDVGTSSSSTVFSTDDTAAATASRTLQQRYAPANCLNGWTITGECVTTTYYVPPAAIVASGAAPAQLEYSQRCSQWTPDLVRRAATRIGCTVGSFVCGSAALACRTVCTSLAAIAQAKCVDKRQIDTFIAPDLVKTSYVCCGKCSALDRLRGRCPQ